MDKIERNRVTTIVCFVAAGGICWGSINLSLGSLHRPGPGFFSFCAGAILGTLSLAVFLQSFKTQRSEEAKPFWSCRGRGLRMVCVLAAFILYAIGLKFLGYALDTFLFLVFLLVGIERQRWSVVLITSTLGVLVSYGIFNWWLSIPLPQGIFGF